jgi:hypothetical protein
VDRIESYLLESEKIPVSSYPLRQKGSILLRCATVVWDGVFKIKLDSKPQEEKSSIFANVFIMGRKILNFSRNHYHYFFCGYALNNSLERSGESFCNPAVLGASPISEENVEYSRVATELEFEKAIKDAQIDAAEKKISELESEISQLRNSSFQKGETDNDKFEYNGEIDNENYNSKNKEKLIIGDRLLTLSRISMKGSPGDLISVVVYIIILFISFFSK